MLTAEPDPGSCVGCRRAEAQRLRATLDTPQAAAPSRRAEVVGAAVLLVIGLLAGLGLLGLLGELVSDGKAIDAYWMVVTAGMAAGTIRTAVFLLRDGSPGPERAQDASLSPEPRGGLVVAIGEGDELVAPARSPDLGASQAGELSP